MKKRMDWETIGQSKIVSQLKIGGEFILAGAEIGFGLAEALFGLKTVNQDLIIAGVMLVTAGVIRCCQPKSEKWIATMEFLEGFSIAATGFGLRFGNAAVGIGQLSPDFIDGAVTFAGFVRMEQGLGRFRKNRKPTNG